MSDLRSLYQQIILDHARTPEGRGLAPAGPTTTESHQVNPTCGDEVRMRVEVSGGVITSVTWEGQGCSISQASISVLVGLVTGQTPAEAERIAARFRELMDLRGQEPDPELAEELDEATAFAGVSKFPARIKCALLGWAALHECLLLAESDQGRTDNAPTGEDGELP